MPVLRIANAAREQLMLALTDPVTGLNARLAQFCAASDYNISPVLAVNFSKSVWQCKVSPDSLEDTDNTNYPLLAIYTEQEDDSLLDTFIQGFSGTVAINVDAYLSWKASRVRRDFDCYPDVFVAALVATLNDKDLAWSNGVGWGGRVVASRGPMVLAGENWLQMIRCALRFDVRK